VKRGTGHILYPELSSTISRTWLTWPDFWIFFGLKRGESWRSSVPYCGSLCKFCSRRLLGAGQDFLVFLNLLLSRHSVLTPYRGSLDTSQASFLLRTQAWLLRRPPEQKLQRRNTRRRQRWRMKWSWKVLVHQVHHQQLDFFWALGWEWQAKPQYRRWWQRIPSFQAQPWRFLPELPSIQQPWSMQYQYQGTRSQRWSRSHCQQRHLRSHPQ